MFNKRSYALYRFLFLFSIISLLFFLWSFIAYSEGPCPTVQIKCGTTCVSPSTDSKNCGVCGRDCIVGFVCKDGTCVKGGATKGGKIIKSGENDSAIAAPFISGGATVSAPISGLSGLKDAAGSNGIGSVSGD